jgi:hypothetical protein
MSDVGVFVCGSSASIFDVKCASFQIGCGGMNFDVEASDEQNNRKRGRDAETILHADGISSFEARRINVSALPFIFYSTAHIWCRCSCYLDSSK